MELFSFGGCKIEIEAFGDLLRDLNPDILPNDAIRLSYRDLIRAMRSPFPCTFSSCVNPLFLCVCVCVCMEASIQISCKIFYHQKPGSWVKLGRLKIPQNHPTILQTFLTFFSFHQFCHLFFISDI